MTPRLLKATLLISIAASCTSIPMSGRHPAFSAGTCDDLIAPFFSAKYRYVKNINDFYQHTYLHRRRLIIMGHHLLEEFPDQFTHIDHKILDQFLNIHDEAKLNLDIAQYKGRPLLEALYQYYGRGKHTLSDEAKIEMQEIIKVLNHKDSEIGINFFKKYGFIDKRGRLNETALELLRIEKIVDSVDRGMNQVSIEEFDRSMTPASTFLKSEDSDLALNLESIYHHLLDGMLRPLPEQSRHFQVSP
ncbi:MAG: hypothetical protein COW00_00240 [Bdellovibrio sp. CG12_big_fil_rev_8_21_14_0_65_39_13]|nr:MAG: hypothetical protein COW78_19855 [Bdellovibrio sp. CG22_combo_CG10-13_8_21_14_all_39_27]PIQ62912.1 MAG: hypothetical protein COW00_00240 [Bdellovibrio sp. CG12_big_fil_rev_8_21_14_0_65_39_13]PIR33267.1 MAG: hypothetical protein COV37_16975 [Bdellovibrio sp. CG11_big_fil_rev_8_21_14_0_20_39_38]PJB54594.1 MAG: hypothetical protein CO099_00685 [Bdellovibrio sp. CG_4_9_14_3_um_filter_39_7]